MTWQDHQPGRRIMCCVPGCRRTLVDNGKFNEWICQKHWSAVPRRDRKVYNRRKRIIIQGCLSVTFGAASDRLWNRCKREAIERAVGI